MSTTPPLELLPEDPALDPEGWELAPLVPAVDALLLPGEDEPDPVEEGVRDAELPTAEDALLPLDDDDAAPPDDEVEPLSEEVPLLEHPTMDSNNNTNGPA